MLRYEYKYLVPNALLSSLRLRLLPFVKEDRYAQEQIAHQYTVRSLYYDSGQHDFYHDKVDGVTARKKVRIRGYNLIRDDDLVYLEIKRKYGVFIDKQRIPVAGRNLAALLATRDIERYVRSLPNFDHAQEEARQFFYQLYAHRLQPQLVIVYDREAYFGRFDQRLRLTFDKGVRFCSGPTVEALFSDRPLTMALTDHFVLEIKFHSGLPEWIRTLVTEFQLQRIAVSKYTLCRDAQASLKKRHSISATF
jgi:hypothetical protein